MTFLTLSLGYRSTQRQYTVTGWNKVFVLTHYPCVAVLHLSGVAPPQYDLKLCRRGVKTNANIKGYRVLVRGFVHLEQSLLCGKLNLKFFWSFFSLSGIISRSTSN